MEGSSRESLSWFAAVLLSLAAPAAAGEPHGWPSSLSGLLQGYRPEMSSGKLKLQLDALIFEVVEGCGASSGEALQVRQFADDFATLSNEMPTRCAAVVASGLELLASQPDSETAKAVFTATTRARQRSRRPQLAPLARSGAQLVGAGLQIFQVVHEWQKMNVFCDSFAHEVVGLRDDELGRLRDLAASLAEDSPGLRPMWVNVASLRNQHTQLATSHRSALVALDRLREKHVAGALIDLWEFANLLEKITQFRLALCHTRGTLLQLRFAQRCTASGRDAVAHFVRDYAKNVHEIVQQRQSASRVTSLGHLVPAVVGIVAFACNPVGAAAFSVAGVLSALDALMHTVTSCVCVADTVRSSVFEAKIVEILRQVQSPTAMLAEIEDSLSQVSEACADFKVQVRASESILADFDRLAGRPPQPQRLTGEEPG